MLRRRQVVFLGGAALLLGLFVAADMLTRVSDTLGSSAPNATTTHAIVFTVAQTIPASGSIVITPHAGYFVIPPDFDFTDVDVSVASSASYVDRELAETADVSADGVTIVTGSSGSITITLNASEGINAGEVVRIELGTNAVFGVEGDQGIVNPASVGSYYIDLMTRDALASTIDTARTMVAIVPAVTIAAAGENIPPILSSGLPSGTIAAGNDEIEISLETNEIATCRYATSSDVTYAAMTEDFSSAGGTVFYTTISGHNNATTYTYYVRCMDYYGTVNTDDYEITFTLDSTPISNTSISSGSASGSGTGPISGGSAVLFLSTATLSGLTSPQSTVTILRDGVSAGTAVADSAGVFSVRLAGLERGVYTFLTYTTDRAQRKSASLASTITLGQGTNNSIANLFIPPTIAIEESGTGDALVSGESVPGSLIEIFAEGGGGEKKYTATAGGDGVWNSTIPAGDIRGTLLVRARARTGDSVSDLSDIVILGGSGGTTASTDGDLNQDGKVNLVDFSIMLSAWGTNAAGSDLNSDGTVNLADFSILLFNWTG